MKAFLQRLVKIWASLPGEVRGAMFTAVIASALLALGFLVLGLDDLWEKLWQSILARSFPWAGMLLFVIIIVLVLLGTIIWGRFAVRRAYHEAVQDVKQSLEQKVTELGELASQIETSHEETKNTFRDWLKTADGVLSAAARGALYNLWLSHPWEYIGFIEETDKAYSNQTRPQRHLERVTLYGTMVGFAFLLPEALRNHACRAEGAFRHLRIIASDAVTTIGETAKELVHYPLWLAARVTQELLSNCLNFPQLLQKRHEFRMEICYLPHDLLNAAIHLPPVEIVVLQALDSVSFSRVLDGAELQVGFRYPNVPSRQDAYDRYVAVLENVAKQFGLDPAGSATAGQRRCEIWTLTGNAGVQTLKVANPHWKWENDDVARVFTWDEYDREAGGDVEFRSGDTVKNFVCKLMAKLRVAGSTGTDLTGLEPNVAEKKQLWATRQQMVCPCSVRSIEAS